MTKTNIRELEIVVRPIVEGQLRSFLNDHPDTVKWKRKRFVESMSKRITNDLSCGVTAARLRAALVGETATLPKD